MGSGYLNNSTGFEIAIIGMSGRFPGAKNIDVFWDNLREGKESITFFTEKELLTAGISYQILKHPNYVNAGGVIDDYDKFDAEFFKYSPREAELLNHQDRMFLESAWEAFENAGYDILNYKKPVGVFVGFSSNQYYLLGKTSKNGLDDDNYWQQHILTDTSFLPTRLSFHLNLTGPSMAIQTACSSSLVAVHVACQSLLNGECSMALAGGVSISEKQTTGYIYQKNMIMSSDGHCRAFDNNATGTVIGNGLGIVILKRLKDAISDGDKIDAVIKGSAVNNDGSAKTGYTAPSVDGQAKAITEALSVSGVNPETIFYIEAHGTGTILGDPIELEGLKKAFASFTDKKQFCRIGSVKTNIGHLDSAAGIAGLIKTVLSLQHKYIPPSLNFSLPNAAINFKNSPFFVNAELTKWDFGCLPRRAGVSSLGIGGTNAHVVLEEAQQVISKKSRSKVRIICLSAKTEKSLYDLMDKYLEFLAVHNEISIDDLAYTLQIGRAHHRCRAVIVCETLDELIEKLQKRDGDGVLINLDSDNERKLVFMFPGQGNEYFGMGNYLYKRYPVFKSLVDECSDILLPVLNLDVRDFLHKKNRGSRGMLEGNTQVIQIFLFVIEYALARLLITLNITPNYMLGHSIGEYIAACLSGVFSLTDALHMVCFRGKYMQEAPDGSMLAVSSAYDAIKPFVVDRVFLAAVNTENTCVLSGESHKIKDVKKILADKGIASLILPVSHPFHSELMRPAAEKFKNELDKIEIGSIHIPFVSNLTGEIAGQDEIECSEYWVKHISKPVLFAKGLSSITEKENDAVFLEVGPGHALTSFVLNHGIKSAHGLGFSSMPTAKKADSSEKQFCLFLGKLWVLGIGVDFVNYYHKEKRMRVSLPTYQFTKSSYWIVNDNIVNKFDIDSFPKVHQDVAIKKEQIVGDAMVSKIAKIWEEVFGINNIDYHANFFDLGGTSLLAIQIVAKIKQLLNIDISITSVFTKNTVFDLSLFVEKAALSIGNDSNDISCVEGTI